MVKPCKGATRKQLLELFGQRVFYHVHHGHKGVGDALQEGRLLYH